MTEENNEGAAAISSGVLKSLISESEIERVRESQKLALEETRKRGNEKTPKLKKR